MESPLQNTNRHIPTRTLMTVIADNGDDTFTRIVCDAVNRSIVMEQVDDAGELVDGAARVELNLDDLDEIFEAAVDVDPVVKFRELPVCVDIDGEKVTRYVAGPFSPLYEKTEE